jgi:hypothetical protein
VLVATSPAVHSLAADLAADEQLEELLGKGLVSEEVTLLYTSPQTR